MKKQRALKRISDRDDKLAGISEGEFNEESSEISTRPEDDSPSGSDVLESEEYAMGLEFDPEAKEKRNLKRQELLPQDAEQ